MICSRCNSILTDESKFCQYCGNKTEIQENSDNLSGSGEDAENTSKKSNKEKKIKIRYCKRCGAVIDNETRICKGCGKKYFKIRKKSILFLILALSLITNVCLCSKVNNLEKSREYFIERVDELRGENSYLEEKRAELDSEVDELKAENRKLKSPAEFFDKYAALVNKNSKKYHKYSCVYFDKTSSFWIYNIAAAQDEGYYPCSTCH